MSTQQKFKGVDGWGGRRKRAGRPNMSGKLNHKKRPSVDINKPIHITHKLEANLPSLRRQCALKVFRKAAIRAEKFGLHLLQYSLQSNHLHILAEAKSNKALASGMRAISKSLAHSLNKRMYRVGSVFRDRFHLRLITCPTQMRNALAYVLLNNSHHVKGAAKIDRYSSGAAFRGWTRLIGHAFETELEMEEAGICLPSSWLARVGWLRAMVDRKLHRSH